LIEAESTVVLRTGSGEAVGLNQVFAKAKLKTLKLNTNQSIESVIRNLID